MSEPISAAAASGRKTIDYICTCCGTPFVSGRAKQEILCVDCIEIRRALRGFQTRGLTTSDILNRAGKLLSVQ